MPHTLTNLGPALTKGDVNRDGLLDIFIGGGRDQPSVLYIQLSSGTFSKAQTPAFEQDKKYEDIDALFLIQTGIENLTYT